MLIHDPPLRKPYWDIRHPRNLEFRALYPPTDSRRLAAMQREMDGSVSQSVISCVVLLGKRVLPVSGKLYF